MTLPIDTLKRQAKRLAKANRINHSEALDQIARTKGFGNWSLLMRHAEFRTARFAPGLATKSSRLTAIRAVMDREPKLSTHGIGLRFAANVSPTERLALFEEARTEMLSDCCLEEFEHCCRWLGWVRRTKHVNWRVGSSYGLKHRVEDYWHKHFPDEHYYVSNGMFIAAAVHLGFKVEQIDSTLNAYLNISSRDFPDDPKISPRPILRMQIGSSTLLLRS